jgi:hypothetical protein
MGIFPAAYVEILEDDNGMEGSGISNSNEPVQLPEPSDSVARLKSSNTIDSLLALSPEAQFPPSVQTSDAQTIYESDIFDDEYFKVNMPSVYRRKLENKMSESETYSAQPLVEIDVVPYGITLYPFFAQFDNELSFHEDEIVTLCRHIDKDWIEGKIDGKKGIFPKSYVNILVDCGDYTSAVGDANYSSSTEPQQFSNSMNTKCELTPDVFAKVLYNFDAQMNGDLTVQKDEVVCIVSKANEDWCEVRNQSGKNGLCPQNYLTPYLLPDELKSKLHRGTSLATDNLLGFFSSSEENANNNSEDTQYISSNGSRRNYQSLDFVLPGSVSSQKQSSIESLISKNLETYRISAQTSRSQSNHRHSLDLTENRNAGYKSGNADEYFLRHNLSVSPKLQQEESSSIVEQLEGNSEHVAIHHPSPSGLRPLQHQEDGKCKPVEESSNGETSWEEGKLSLYSDHI